MDLHDKKTLALMGVLAVAVIAAFLLFSQPKGGATCGDGYCDSAAGEGATCLQDCPAIENGGRGADASVTCGDGKCEDVEDPDTCPQDCEKGA